MTEPERDDKAEQDASNEFNKQKTEQLIKLQREIPSPRTMLSILNTLVGIIVAVGTVGVLAYYLLHKILAEILLFISFVSLLFIPVVIALYVRSLLPKKARLAGPITRTGRLLDKWLQSPVNKVLIRIGNNRIARFLGLAFYACMVAYSISSFPKHPRFSLTYAVIYMAMFFWNVLLFTVEATEKRLDRRIDLSQKDLIDISKMLNAEIKALDDLTSAIAKGLNQHLTDMSELLPIQGMADEAQSAALRAIQTVVLALNDKINLMKQVQSEPPSEPPSESDKEPPKIGT